MDIADIDNAIMNTPVFNSIKIGGIDYKYLENFNEVYTIRKKLGKGVYGTTYLCESNGGLVATKFVQVNNEFYKQIREIEMLKYSAELDEIPKYIDSFVCRMGKGRVLFLVLVMEYLKGVSLYDYVMELHKNNKYINPKIFLKMAMWLLNVVGKLHDKNIIHKDIKPENIIVVNGTIKLIDFGLSCTTTGSLHCSKDDIKNGSPYYMSPELLLMNLDINDPDQLKSADIWAVGVTLIFLLEQNEHWKSDELIGLIHEINTFNHYDYDFKYPYQDIVSEVLTLLERQWNRRPTAQEAYENFRSLYESETFADLYEPPL